MLKQTTGGKLEYCNKIIRLDSQAKFRCKKEKGHTGRCQPTPFLNHFKEYNNAEYGKVAQKIEQDAYHTRGNKTRPFKNRSFRWDTPVENPKEHKDEENLGIPKKEYASQEECFQVAQKLTKLAYEMAGAPKCPPEIEKRLDKKPIPNNARCPICKGFLDINDFKKAEWGKALIEMCHIYPLGEDKIMHNYENIGWAHRHCNIAQQERSIPEFLKWISKILEAHGHTVKRIE